MDDGHARSLALIQYLYVQGGGDRKVECYWMKERERRVVVVRVKITLRAAARVALKNLGAHESELVKSFPLSVSPSISRVRQTFSANKVGLSRGGRRRNRRLSR